MADKKISALPASTTPLAGTEVLPIVQSSATVQVSVANLTAGRAISATQLTLTTGNLIVASGQGIDFSATSHPAGMTSELFNDYEEGTWTPTLTASVGTITTVGTCTGQYTKIGRQVTLSMDLRITTNGIAAGFISVGGIPINIGTTLYGAGCGSEIGVTGKLIQISPATQTTFNLTNYDGTYPGATGFRADLTFTYFV